MPTIKLTEAAVRNIKPTASVTDHWDDELKGFALRVHPTGRKSWLARWRDKASGKKKFESAGTWPTVRASEAREWARETLSRASLGLPTRKEENAAHEAAEAVSAGPTVADVWAEYEKRAGDTERKTREGLGRLHVLPKLGSLPISDLQSSQIDTIVRAMSNKPRTGNKIKIALHGAFELARTLNMVDENRRNPASLVKGYDPNRRSRRLSDDELAKVGKALSEARKNRRFELLHAELILMLLLTGARVGEMSAAEREMVDEAYPAVVLKRHKTMKKGVRRVELGPEAWKLLQGLPQQNEYLFYGRTGQGPISSTYKAWLKLRGLAGIDHATIHDLRRTFASVARDDGMSLHDIGVLLGHQELSVTGIYAVPDLKRRQALIAQAEASVWKSLFKGAPASQEALAALPQ